MSPPVGVALAAQGGGAVDSLSDVMLALNPYKLMLNGEASGIVCIDEQGNGNGTYVNTPTLGEPGVPGGGGVTSVHFDAASTEYADFGTDTSFYGLTEFSIVTFVKMDAAASVGRFIAGQFDLTNNDERTFLLYVNQNAPYDLRFITRDSAGGFPNTGTPQSAINDGDWHMVSADVDQVDDQMMRLYVDGLPVGTPAAHANPIRTPSTDEPLIIGAGKSASVFVFPWDGHQTHTGLWIDKALTAAEHAAIFAASGI